MTTPPYKAHNASYYSVCFAGGALACSATHLAVTPLDVSKCNMQVNPLKYPSLGKGMRAIIAEEGASALIKGWFPTVVGYAGQGLCKYGLYEVFKDLSVKILGEDTAKKYRPLVWCTGAAAAEFVGDIFLCPFEMVKVKVQTSPPKTWPISFFPALRLMRERSIDTRFPFGSLIPLWSRQIPYTVSKFVCFEKCVQLFYTHVFTAPKESYSKPTQLGVTFMSGYLAGIVCALVSHPSDTLVSLMGKADNKGKSYGQIIKEVGFYNLATKGLGTRIIMIGTLTACQWWIYDSFKAVFGLSTTGGK